MVSPRPPSGQVKVESPLVCAHGERARLLRLRSRLTKRRGGRNHYDCYCTTVRIAPLGEPTGVYGRLFVSTCFDCYNGLSVRR